MSALAVATAESAPTPQQPHLTLVQTTSSCARIDVLATSGALLLVAAVVAGLIDVVNVGNGGTPIGLSAVMLVASLPGLTQWAHRIDRKCGRSGRR